MGITFCFLFSFGYTWGLQQVLRITHQNICNGYSELLIKLSFSELDFLQSLPADQNIYLLIYLVLYITGVLRAWSQVGVRGSSLKSRVTFTYFNIWWFCFLLNHKDFCNLQLIVLIDFDRWIFSVSYSFRSRKCLSTWWQYICRGMWLGRRVWGRCVQSWWAWYCIYTWCFYVFIVAFFFFSFFPKNECVYFLEYVHLKSATVYFLCINRGARCDEVCSPAIHIPS